MSEIKIDEVSKVNRSGIRGSRLTLKITGSTVKTVNTLRRIAYEEVPTYAFARDDIIIEENSSNAFNNDQVTIRISQLPIYDLDVPEKYISRTDAIPDGKLKVDMYINQHNSSMDVFDVTTNHAQTYLNGKLTKIYNEQYPIVLMQLRKGETFKCKLTSKLGVGRINRIWTAAANCYYEYEKEKDITFNMESLGQMDEYDIIFRSCNIISERLKEIKNKIDKEYGGGRHKDDKQIEIKLVDETHTLCDVINEKLQMHPKVRVSAISKPTFLLDTMVIKLVTDVNDPLKIVYEVIDDVDKMYTDIGQKIKEIGGKYIK